jgi:ribosomal protein L37E
MKKMEIAIRVQVMLMAMGIRNNQSTYSCELCGCEAYVKAYYECYS